MTEKKWTKGPWVWVDRDTETSCVKGSDGSHVAGDLWWNNDRDEANAHLIAAAPDLYDACEAVFDAVDMTDKEQYAALKLVVAALAKARGEK